MTRRRARRSRERCRPGTTLERPARLTGAAAEPVAQAIVDVLLEAFGVEADRRPGIAAETVASLADPRFTHYLVRLDGEPVAVARRATFDGLCYLSSIGTIERARGHGLGRLVTATAVVDAVAAGSEWVHLGVFADNPPAYGLYGGLGFTPSGAAGSGHGPYRVNAVRHAALEDAIERARSSAPAGTTVAGIGWSTVDLERAERELLGIRIRGRVHPTRSSARAVGSPPESLAVPLVLLEPATEGRLAASLARLGEGPVVDLARRAGPTARRPPVGSARARPAR